MSQPPAHSETPLNRLAGESSPYLLLHRHNPVDWYPWGEEALARAKEEDKPIFLSVGYSTCYWCHVMERESFSDPEIAELMNREFVNIKLDREERPDLDEIYMAATQILSGHGGWPNSVFLTPDLKPFYAGTYFPPEGRHGLPAFGSVLESLADAFAHRRPDVEAQAEEMEGAMRRFLEERVKPALVAPKGGAAAGRAVEALARRFDASWGGFGGAPKFPTPSNLFLLLEMADAETRAGEMLTATLDQMARGGIYDQLGGGFHRYATDREWKVPHFEKMLYDNGLLLELYAREAGRGGELAGQAARIVRETAAFLEREMTSPEGAFWSAIDAETHGHEGAFYVWTRAEIANTLGAEDAAFLAPLLGFDGPPFFEGNRYVLHLPETWGQAAARRRLDEEDLRAEALPLLAKLLEARGRRERPATDDKILTDWNGTAIAGLATAGMILGEPDYVACAVRAADFFLRTLRPGGGPLLHAWRAGQGKIAAYLSDYAFLVRGLLALHEATREERYLAAAVELTGEQIERLADPAGGFFVAGERPDVLFRSKEIFDGAMPAANAVAALNLLELADRTGDSAFRERAEAALKAFGPLVEGAPDAVKMMAIAAHRFDLRQATAAAPAAVGTLDAEARGTVAARVAWGEPGADGGRAFRLTLEIAPGWHVNANPAGVEGLQPTTVAAAGGAPLEVAYPPPTRPAVGEEPALYEGTVEITGRAGGADLVLTCQPCDAARCLPVVVLRVEG